MQLTLASYWCSDPSAADDTGAVNGTGAATRQFNAPAPELLNETFSRDHSPVAHVVPGETFTVHSLDAAGHLERQTYPGEVRPVALPARRGHCLVGPILVEGARAGQVLGVHFETFTPDPWGYTVAGGRDNILNRRLGVVDSSPAWLLWDIDAEAGTAINQHGISVAQRPFLGVTGVALAEPGEHSTIPPRTVGAGNIDCREVVAGSTLFIPIAVDGALLYLGDGHSAQGDGEVGGTAIECGMTTTLFLQLLDSAALGSVHAVTPTSRITFGFNADLNAAAGDALDAMLDWLAQLLTLDRASALAVASTAVDLRITQIANTTWGVHAVVENNRIRPV